MVIICFVLLPVLNQASRKTSVCQSRKSGSVEGGGGGWSSEYNDEFKVKGFWYFSWITGSERGWWHIWLRSKLVCIRWEESKRSGGQHCKQETWGANQPTNQIVNPEQNLAWGGDTLVPWDKYTTLDTTLNVEAVDHNNSPSDWKYCQC